MQWALGLLGALVLGWLAVGRAAADLDRLLLLAQQRYGAYAVQTAGDWRRLMQQGRGLADRDKLTLVNTFFNRRMFYKTDREVYRLDDYWATPLELMGHAAGDCEDFVIAKYATLRLLGVPNQRLRLVYVRYQSGNTAPIAHMVLGYYAEASQEPLILDSLITSIRSASMRPDLMPVYSFNSDGLWVGAASISGDPTTRLSRWRDVLERMRQDGLELPP
ncbi:MAG: transglutaminase-like cysteine peptidase [Rhodoferax sp.]|nr:transglutaminase-like cysteine peptidase [Rhodoferax sp.]